MMTVKLKVQQIPPPRPFKYSSVLGVLAHKRLFIVIITVPFKVKDHVTPIAKSSHIKQSIIARILADTIFQNCTRLHYKNLLVAS